MQFIENKTFDELQVGDAAQSTKSLHTSAAGLDAIVELLMGRLPGPGAVLVDLSLKFRAAPAVGDSVIARVRLRDKTPDTRQLTVDCECVGPTGEILAAGTARVIAPAAKVRRPLGVAADVPLFAVGSRFRQLVEAAKQTAPIRTAVVHPCDAVSVASAMQALRSGLIVPMLVGPAAKIHKAAEDAQCDLKDVEIIDAPHSHGAAERAVALAREARVDALMKGALHTDELMAAVVDKSSGLRTERRMSHVFALDVPHYAKPLFITDAAVNTTPDLDTKRDIIQNAIDLLHALGIDAPRIAILAAVETVNAKMPSTVDAAALCKMADRGQIRGGILDGPLAFDNAISSEAAATKGISSKVAGVVDILVVPDLEAGNMLVKQLVYLAGAQAAGIVLGARLPIVLTSRADDDPSRLASCALAQLMVHRKP